MPTKKVTGDFNRRQATAKPRRSRTPWRGQRWSRPPVAKRWHLVPQLTIAGSAIALLLLLGTIDRITFATRPSKAAEMLPATIGIEYDQPLRLSVLVARKEQAGYTSITNQSDETVHLSVPSTWTRTEVTGVPLGRVTQDIPVFGFTRWTLPAHAGVNMLMSQAPNSFFFDSTSTLAAAIDLQTIDLVKLHASSRVLLLQKQLLVALWGDPHP